MSLGLQIPHHLLLSLRRGGFFPHQSPQLDFCAVEWGCSRLRSNGREEDPEPGRCRRTDGKKWRCSRVACPDSKYCERHLHRGKNRLRKHMESSVLHTNTPASSPSSPLSLLPPENQRKRLAQEDLRNDNGGEQASSSATSGLSFQHCFVMGKDLSLERSSESDNPISLHCFFDDRPKDERREEELPGSASTNPASSFSLFDLNV
ncbi:Growth-regulating factor 1 [Platanthera guangdongensis]|uniref:Growth-regulating factor n=1 Tax=Platanthera guangdongensis TaxID=2320717 RepID=A0ABR2LJZ4_9ASPA